MLYTLPPSRLLRDLVAADGVLTFVTEENDPDALRVFRVPACGGTATQISTTTSLQEWGLSANASDAYYAVYEDGFNAARLHHIDVNGNETAIEGIPVGERGVVLDQGEVFTFILDSGAIVKIDGGIFAPIAAIGPVQFASNILVGPERITWVAGPSGTLGRIVSTARAGGEPTIGPEMVVPYEIAAVDGGFIATTFIDDNADPPLNEVQRVTLDGKVTTLAAQQVAGRVKVSRDHAIWSTDGQIRAVHVDGGDTVVVVDGVYVPYEPRSFAADADAVYVEQDGDIVRVPLPF